MAKGKTNKCQTDSQVDAVATTDKNQGGKECGGCANGSKLRKVAPVVITTAQKRVEECAIN